jgi:SAM-dependent methyltransferase
MDKVAKHNIERWNALAAAKAIFTRPHLDLDKDSAQSYLDPQKRLGDVFNKNVLCLAAGGGQQSIAFALLGANVTVIDISDAQLKRDAEAAAHYGLSLKLIQGDMRDLSHFERDSFDIVWHPYSLNIVPDARVVFKQVARVLRENGIYYFMCANPFFIGLSGKDWKQDGYRLKLPYVDGAEITIQDETWVYNGENPNVPVVECREHRHNLSTLINGLIEHGFLVLKVSEQNFGEPNFEADPGTSEHFTSIAPPWLIFWAKFRPDVLSSSPEN